MFEQFEDPHVQFVVTVELVRVQFVMLLDEFVLAKTVSFTLRLSW